MANRYWVGNGGTWDNSDTTHWASTSGGSSGASAPTFADDVFFDANSFTINEQIVLATPSAGVACNSISFSGVTNSPTFTSYGGVADAGNVNVYGNLTGASSLTMSFNFIFRPSALSRTITSNSMTYRGNIQVNDSVSSPGGTLTLADALLQTSDKQFIVQFSGTFDANDLAMTLGTFYLYSGTVNMGNGTWTIKNTTSTNAAGFRVVGGTLNCENSTLAFDYTSFVTTSLSISCTQTLKNITINGAALSKRFNFLTAVTATSLVLSNPPISLYFTYGTTCTFTTFNVQGSSGNLVTIRSDSSGRVAYISGTTVTVQYIDVKDNYALGSIPFDNSTGGVDSGNNTNWNFGGASAANLTSLITAVNRVTQNLTFPQFVIAGQGGAASNEYKLFKKSTTYGNSIWRSAVYNIGMDFDVLEIVFGMTPVVLNTSIIPILYFDDESSSSVGEVIDSINYPNSDQLIVLRAPNFSNSVHGKDNFFLELQFTGNALAVVELPITIELEIKES